VGEIADSVEALNGFTNVRTALSARQWMEYSELPVVDGRHRVIGVVSRASVTRVAGESSAVTFNLEQVFSELANAYLEVCARMLESLLGKPK
jgi:predicted transcriptional regulator